MKSWTILIFLFVAEPLFAQSFPTHTASVSLEAPISFDRLTVWIIDGANFSPHHYLILEAALATGRAVIFNENSQTLRIINRSDSDLFLEAGDLIKGGQQDRMIADDRILAAHDSTNDLDVFCVEQGRSSARGTEPLATFSASDWMAPFAHTRLVSRSALTEQLLTPNVGGLTAPDSSQIELLQSLQNVQESFVGNDPVQESIWNDVTDIQKQLTHSLQDSVTKNTSPTSLELILENTSLTDRERLFVKHFGDVARRNAHAVGFVYAIDGWIAGAEQYATHDLFASMWPKLLRSIAAAAIAKEPFQSTSKLPSTEDVQNFLLDQGLQSARETVNSRTMVEASKTQTSTRFVTQDTEFPDVPLHVEWIAK